MGLARPAYGAALLLIGLAWSAAAVAQDLALAKDSEEGFRRFIHMAQSGSLGDDVTNANVGILADHARVELVRTGAPAIVLRLTPKSSAQASCRYFKIESEAHASARDVARVCTALDECFGADPFHLPGLEESVAGAPIPALAEAWAYGRWRGVLLVLERRMMVIASLRYTLGVIVALVLVLLASLVLLWGSTPPVQQDSRGMR